MPISKTLEEPVWQMPNLRSGTASEVAKKPPKLSFRVRVLPEESAFFLLCTKKQILRCAQDDNKIDFFCSLFSRAARGPTQTGFSGRPARDRLLESLVDLDLVTGSEAIRFIGHAHDGHEFLKHLRGHPFALCRCGVRSDAVGALIRDADGDVDHLLCKRIEGARRHDLLDGFPGALERRGIVGEGLPEMIDVIGLARRENVVVNGAYFRRRVFIFNQARRSQSASFS